MSVAYIRVFTLYVAARHRLHFQMPAAEAVAILKGNWRHADASVRPEQASPSYAGSSFRQGFLLKKENLLIEVSRIYPAFRLFRLFRLLFFRLFRINLVITVAVVPKS